MHSNPDILYRISFTRAKVTPERTKAKTGRVGPSPWYGIRSERGGLPLNVVEVHLNDACKNLVREEREPEGLQKRVQCRRETRRLILKGKNPADEREKGHQHREMNGPINTPWGVRVGEWAVALPSLRHYIPVTHLLIAWELFTNYMSNHLDSDLMRLTHIC